ncbi:glyoxylate/hydroxypyruvate reductase A [Flavobacteriaceae bacterium R38]|nr:glyoxylate/hydroxypyruvate reductase A [Flavobacteriaceae bacterium R38]
MSIALIFENKDPKPWAKILQEKIPDTKVEIYPDVQNQHAIDFVICWKPKPNILKEFPNIKVIQSVGAAIDHITSSQTLENHHIITRIVDNKLSNDMWEFLLTVILSQLKNNTIYARQQQTKIWTQHSYASIKDTTISILGLGSIGGHVAKKFAELGFKVKGWSTSEKDILNVESFSEKEVLNPFLKDSDFLINLLPLTEKTEGILNKELLKKLPKNTFLINVGRGEHLIEEDLIELLDNGDLSGALLDVFREEPLPEKHSFWQHPKIQITPHVASLTNIESATDQIVENHRLFLNKKELLNTVKLEKGY